MKIYELLKRTRPEEVISKIKLYYVDKDIELYKELYNKLLNMESNINAQNLYIFITSYIEDKDSRVFGGNDLTIDFDVSAYELSSDSIYSIAASPYADFLNYTIDDNTLRNFTFSEILAHCFYEITAYGFEDNV